MKAIGEVLKLAAAFLAERKIDRPRRIAEELLACALQLKRMDLYLQFDKPVLEEELATLRAMVKRCAKGEPLEYVTGEVEFFGCRIKLDRRVLIPRPETELLVELVSKRLREGTLWDVCTGSGAIGIALKKAHPQIAVFLSDLCSEALSLAAENARLNDAKVAIFQGDLLAPFQGRKADCVVCNPPYVSQEEYERLDPAVRCFEPQQALLAGEKGTAIYERLASELPPYLNPGAQVFFEIGATQGETLKKIFPLGQLHCDWAGHPRFFFLKRGESI